MSIIAMPVSSVRKALNELLSALDSPVFVTARGRVKAVLMGIDGYNALLAELDNLRDTCAHLQQAQTRTPAAFRQGTSGTTTSSGGSTMTKLTPYEIYTLLNQAAPLWLARIDLSEANLSWANLQGADLRAANLARCTLIETNLSRANLSWANLQGTDLSWANLAGANLAGADLRGANLCGANLAGADLTAADLTNATYDSLTTWPEGGAPLGAHKVGE